MIINIKFLIMYNKKKIESTVVKVIDSNYVNVDHY